MTTAYDRFQAEIDACLERHARALKPPSRLESAVNVLGGAGIGSGAVSAANGHTLAAIIAFALGAVLSVPLAVRMARRARLRRDLDRIRQEVNACPVSEENDDA
jgi:ABC-type nitrate/sulfonate/bicarbonate transport system permease component